ncbi:hypothetical protein BN2476_560028 [Paraburkholderia piptadeniae]|uniref:Uncharacterized protein n=1 Tax=Paraburkholderia piptadeniae TaxID=1701573 RepID=A0A1N7SIF6_9BURK|nr:hypothetical protein BN2476_560028 [Paraburkholderia piptadeniae]
MQARAFRVACFESASAALPYVEALPQLLLRVGRGPQVGHAPRHTLSDAVF